jgi:hypothetical protein
VPKCKMCDGEVSDADGYATITFFQNGKELRTLHLGSARCLLHYANRLHQKCLIDAARMRDGATVQ